MSKLSMKKRISAAVQSVVNDPSVAWIADLPVRRCGDFGWGWYVRINTPTGGTYVMFKNIGAAERWAESRRGKTMPLSELLTF